MFGLRPQEMILILLILVLLFGAKKLPDLARGVGRSLRILKAETREMDDTGEETAKDDKDDVIDVKEESKPPKLESGRTADEQTQHTATEGATDPVRRQA